MIKNYFKTAFRTIVKDKLYAGINIIGLTIGLASCMLVFTVVIDEYSYDKFWSKSKDLYRVYEQREITTGASQRFPRTQKGLGTALKENFPEMLEFSEINISEKRIKLNNTDADGIAVQFLIVDTNASSMLDFIPLHGELPEFVAGQTNILITESFRDRHFKDRNPVGELLNDLPSRDDKAQEFLITGVIQDIPDNTHLRAEIVALNIPGNYKLSTNGVGRLSNIYYLLRAGTDPVDFAQKMNSWIENYLTDTDLTPPIYGLQPITEVHLGTGYEGDFLNKGNINTLHILTGVGIMLLFIACINFINLSTARSVKRLKETGVRKVLGANRNQLTVQFLTESILFFSISTLLSMGVYQLALPMIESFIGHGLTFSLTENLKHISFVVLAIILISVLVGVYPAWMLSGMKTFDSLNGKLSVFQFFNVNRIRKSLVVVQFAIAVFVLVSLAVVWHQNYYLASKDIGYDKDNLMYVGHRNWDGKGEVFKQELKKLPGIESVSMSGWSPINGSGTFYGSIDHLLHPGEKIEVHYIISDFDFIQTLGFNLIEGRNLDQNYASDHYNMNQEFISTKEEYDTFISTRSALVTESTAKILGISNTGEDHKAMNIPVAGILKDFHRESLHKALGPVIFLAEQSPDYAHLYVRTTPGMEKQAQASLIKAWETLYPNRFLDAKWVSDILEKHYEAEQKQQLLFTLFSSLMLFLSALGIFGLVVHATQQRTKEIGIRKVLGASVSGIVAMLSKDFVKLGCLAIVIASPIAWWAMNQWLADFAYRIDIQWWMFALAGLVAVVIALLTVATQAIRAAVANPVESLRDE